MADTTEPGILIELDDRRRASLGKVGRPEHRRYFARDEPGGVIVLIPAVVLTATEAALAAAPELADRIDHAMRHPETMARRERPQQHPAEEAGWSTELPEHLRDDAPKQQCTACRRFTRARSEFGTDCRMPQPSGEPCTGLFVEF